MGRSCAHVFVMQLPEKLERRIRHNHGIVTISDWQKAGLDRSSWYRRHDHLLIRVAPGVARTVGAPTTTEQKILGAVLAAGPGAVASHRSAAYLWGADLAGVRPVDVIVKRTSGRSVSDAVLHRPTDRADLRAVRRANVPATNPLRTLLDLGAVCPASVASVLNQFLASGVVNVEGLTRFLTSHRARGRSGTVPLAEAIAALPLGSKPPDSVLEAMGAALFSKYGILDWKFHHVAVGYELDFGFVGAMVDVEFDGWLYHRDRFESDRQRDVELTASGWVVLRFTWRQVTRRPGWVAQTIAAVVSQRSRCAPWQMSN
jgi:Protein of unknown function (DUF559)